MGIVLDSSVLVKAERAGMNARQVIDQLISLFGDTEAVLSAIAVLELAHGVERAESEKRRTGRELFLNELLNETPVEPVSVPIAVRAGKLDGKLRVAGKQVALGDLLIGSTALELGYSVATHNVRHFRVIPDLTVVEL